jgi:hypothetical protein
MNRSAEHRVSTRGPSVVRRFKTSMQYTLVEVNVFPVCKRTCDYHITRCCGSMGHMYTNFTEIQDKALFSVLCVGVSSYWQCLQVHST